MQASSSADSGDEDTEARLTLAIEAAALGLFDLDLTSRLVYWSPRNCEIHGVPPGTPLSLDDCMALLPPDELQPVRRAFDAAMDPDGDGLYRIEHRIVRPDGGERWVHALGRVHFASDEHHARRPVRFTGVTQDITERRQALQRLMESELACRQAEERLRLATESSTLGWWDTDLITHRTVLSDKARRLFDLEHLGTGSIPHSEVLDRMHPEDLPGVVAARLRAFAPDADGSFRHQYRMRRADGGYNWLDAVGQAQFETVDGERRAVRFAGVLWDITVQRETMRALAQSEAQLRAVFDTVPVGIVTAEAPGGRVTGGNRRAETIFGHPILPSPDIDAYRAWVGFHADGRQVRPDEYPMARALRTGEAGTTLELEYQRGDGRRAWIRLVASPIRDPETDAITGGVVVALDIDAERRALEALHDADRRKDEFLAMLAHELRNPLSPIMNALRILARDGLADAQRRAALDMVERQTRQLTRLVDDLLEVSRITRGKIELRPERVMVNAAIYQAVESMDHECRKRAHQVRVHLPAHPVTIQADPARLAQVLENLLANACKYTPDGGRINVHLTEKEGGVEIRVADDGIGIDADKLESVFELFRQVDTTLDRAQGGLGIGLGLVKRLVELHGGRVHAESAGRGRGGGVRGAVAGLSAREVRLAARRGRCRPIAAVSAPSAEQWVTASSTSCRACLRGTMGLVFKTGCVCCPLPCSRRVLAHASPRSRSRSPALPAPTMHPQAAACAVAAGPDRGGSVHARTRCCCRSRAGRHARRRRP